MAPLTEFASLLRKTFTQADRLLHRKTPLGSDILLPD
ncbi:hypothetical protein R77591_04373 [Ralstonia mannitolilytica]|uniref:Uncharacterized protein n=1 Tax=Ralstonia mannitolilytica TaxID=105219 RepID=A0AAD2ENM0_9RALS|nr:hypothetical protein R77591_04373 [Ralstonia mannitolilytica]CAJ0895324.1 hypothetical protein R77569_04484 [Ralstonia mannitolilytica]